MTKAPNTVEVTYESFRIPGQLADYHTVVLTDEEREHAVQKAAAVPESQQELTTDYFLQAAFVEKVTNNSALHAPKQIAHERALSMGWTLQQKFEMDQLIAEFEVGAKQQLRQHIVLLAIAKVEGLEATDTNYANEVERLSSSYSMPIEGLVGFFAASGKNESVRQDISVLSKAADFMKQLALS